MLSNCLFPNSRMEANPLVRDVIFFGNLHKSRKHIKDGRHGTFLLLKMPSFEFERVKMPGRVRIRKILLKLNFATYRWFSASEDRYVKERKKATVSVTHSFIRGKICCVFILIIFCNMFFNGRLYTTSFPFFPFLFLLFSLTLPQISPLSGF